MIRIETILSKNIYNFQEIASLVGQSNRHFLEILLARKHTLVVQNCWASVRLHQWMRKNGDNNLTL